MKVDYKDLAKRAVDMIENSEPHPRVWQENGETTRSKYWKDDKGSVILQAGEGRYDLWRNFQEGFFSSQSVVANSKLEELMKNLMVCDYKNYSGVIMSKPGSKNQYFHRDTDNLSISTNGKALMAVDDFYFTTLIPIEKDIDLENGPTEFLKGSHRKTTDKFNELEINKATCKIGDALLFNGKMNHRGTGNDSKADRPVIYIVHHKEWYDDNYRKGVEY